MKTTKFERLSEKIRNTKLHEKLDKTTKKGQDNSKISSLRTGRMVMEMETELNKVKRNDDLGCLPLRYIGFEVKLGH